MKEVKYGGNIRTYMDKLIGLTMKVQCLPSAGETLLGTGYRVDYGGKGSNQAVGCARLGASDFIVSKILGHATQPGVQVTQVYNRYSHLSEMASALNAWAAHVEKITACENWGADILTLRRA